MTRFNPGDVVYFNESSALLGDVCEVEERDGDEYVKVAWRATVTNEDANDLELSKPAPVELGIQTEDGPITLGQFIEEGAYVDADGVTRAGTPPWARPAEGPEAIR